MVSFDWEPFLKTWSREIIASGQGPALPQDVAASGWLGFPGATEEQIARAEARLGVQLPPSYKEFLRVTNGWRQTGPFIWRMWSTEEIEWFAVRNQGWIDAFLHPPGWGVLPPIPDEEYFVYGEDQNSVSMRAEYLQTALEISEEGDSAIYLLNPRVVTSDGEWEAWFFANWLPGASRYRSFLEMMQAKYESFRRLADL
jgi:hypothetical protein